MWWTTIDTYRTQENDNDLECLGLILAIGDNHSLLANRFFTVYKDHYSLSFLQNLGNSNSRIHSYACLLEGYNYEVKFKSGAENISDVISRLDYANQLKPSDVSVEKCKENIPRIYFIFHSKTNAPITEHSPQVQDTLSKFTFLPSKLLSESQETGTNSSVEASMKEDPLPLMDTCSKPINIGTPNTPQDVSEVHLEAENA